MGTCGTFELSLPASEPAGYLRRAIPRCSGDPGLAAGVLGTGGPMGMKNRGDVAYASRQAGPLQARESA